MGDKTGIEWTGATWNPTRGCSRVSEGCRNCYAERVAGRFSGPGQPYEGLTRRTSTGAKWTGVVRLVPEHLADPLRWRKPRRVFVNSMSDLFHESLSDSEIDQVFGVMAACRHLGRDATSGHTFQILTKRPGRMRKYLGLGRRDQWARWAVHYGGKYDPDRLYDSILAAKGPLPNVWLGVSAEDQATADERIPLLLETPAAVRFVSYEPALGPVDFTPWLSERFGSADGLCGGETWSRSRLDWIIAGSESGPGARPAELEWFRSVRDQCAAAGVAFFFKQWVGHHNADARAMVLANPGATGSKVSLPILDGRQHVEWPR